MTENDLKPKKPRKTLRKKLFFYMLGMAVFLLALLAVLLTLLGRFRTPKYELFEKSDMQVRFFEKELVSHCKETVLTGTHLSEDLAKATEKYLSDNNLSTHEIADGGDVSELEEIVFEPLRQYLLQAEASGAFVFFGENNEKYGLYLQTNGYDPDRQEVFLYCGDASVGRAHGVMPHRSWRPNADSIHFPDLKDGSAYGFTDIFVLPRTSERVMLITFPLSDCGGSLIGICGFEISESYFSQLHGQVSKLKNLTCLLVTSEENGICDGFFSCGARDEYFFTPDGAMTAKDFGGGLAEFDCDGEKFIGVAKKIDSSDFTAIVMTPKSDYTRAEVKNALSVGSLALLLIVLSAVCCVLVSHRYIAPVLHGLEEAKKEQGGRTKTGITEINDLLDFLSEKERMESDRLAVLIEERDEAKIAFDRAQSEIDKLTSITRSTVDLDAFKFFTERLSDLSKTERAIFDLYVSGHSTKDVLEKLGIKESTLKYHNTHIYEKLGVKSRKELFAFIALMKSAEEKQKNA